MAWYLPTIYQASLLTSRRKPSFFHFSASITLFVHIANLPAPAVIGIRHSVPSTIFISSVHFLEMDYCSSLFIALPKVCLSLLQSLLNVAARLRARLPRISHIFYMPDHLHWLHLLVHLQLNILVFIYQSSSGLAPK